MTVSLEEVRELLDGAPFDWWIAGGWALDLYVQRQTRPHADVDVALLRKDQGLLRVQLDGWMFEYADAGHLKSWPDEETLELPIHEIHVRRNERQLEFLLNESDNRDWIFRRDARIRMPLERFGGLVRDGLPVLPPEVVLLYKSNRLDAKNKHDFEAVRAALDDHARRWLREALTPGHPWAAL